VSQTPPSDFTTPGEKQLGLSRLTNGSGLSVSLLPNGTIFSIEHANEKGRLLINQILGSPIGAGMTRLYLRVGGGAPRLLSIGPGVPCRFGIADTQAIWEGESGGLLYRVALRLHPKKNLWSWWIEVRNNSQAPAPCDVVLIQDLGLGDQGFLMGNEAYASQYIDHHIARHERLGPVLMARQNLAQRDNHPWVMHGCIDGAAGYATDFRQIIGPECRDAGHLALPFGMNLPSERLQYETACAALQSPARELLPCHGAVWTFFGYFEPDHPAASSDGDLALISDIEMDSRASSTEEAMLSEPPRSLLQDAPSLIVKTLDEAAIAAFYPQRSHEERRDGRLLSFFVPDEGYERHVVLYAKEREVIRRHGAILRSGTAMLPDDNILCSTAWMHGIFGAQLTMGNTSFHQLFSISRDPYNITRDSGLRMLVDLGEGWRLLTIPSAFEIGLGDCRWIYAAEGRIITIAMTVSGDEAAVQWRVKVEGAPCHFLVFGHLVLGSREFAQTGRIAIDGTRKQFTFRPDPEDIWGKTFPDAIYHLVTPTPEAVEVLGSDEILFANGIRRSGAYAVFRTVSTNEFAFAVTGSMTDAAGAEALAAKYATGCDEAAMKASSDRFWRHVSRDFRLSITGSQAVGDIDAINTIFPWLVHDGMVHLTVPHGLEQYTGAAWGTRDVCQGPVELLLSLEHDAAVKDILRILFAQQYEGEGDWPQWFMLEPYSVVQGREAHGDIIVWPLKALCDYIETTGDLAFLDEPLAWCRTDTLKPTSRADSVSAHVDILLATIEARFVSGTHLIRYGNGDWNDSLQPVDISKRDWMVSSWTVALLYQQVRRYADILRLKGALEKATILDQLADSMRDDFNRHLIRDGIVAGYAVFAPDGGAPELLLHPSDQRTGLHYSLLPMTQAIIADLFTPEQTACHLDLIREHLLFPDGVRLMERPLTYHGGPETIFRRAESSAFFGREIALMYVHSHLRYAEALSVLGDATGLWDALAAVNPISVTNRLGHASLRQRNTYFSSSDAAFADRYHASEDWDHVRHGTIAVDGGWRIYSSGPGLYTNMLIQHVLGRRRSRGSRIVRPCLPEHSKDLHLQGGLWQPAVAQRR